MESPWEAPGQLSPLASCQPPHTHALARHGAAWCSCGLPAPTHPPPEHQLRTVPQLQQGTSHGQRVPATAGGGSEPEQQFKGPHLHPQRVVTLRVVGDAGVGGGAPVTLPPGREAAGAPEMAKAW